MLPTLEAPTPTTAPFPSGRQHEITFGSQRATIVEVGGGIREYLVDERPVLNPYPADAMSDGAHGAPLVPWPNRLRDGSYRFDGCGHQLALTEPEKGNAIHGLLRWRSWRAAAVSAARLRMRTRLHPVPGYPFTLDLRLEYSLGPDGLAVTATATNVGVNACPYAYGHHPYLSPGTGLIDDCTLTLEAATRIVTDERGLPVGQEPVDGTPYDFRGGAVLNHRQVDSAFTDLARDPDGLAWVHVGAPDGRTVSAWMDDSVKYVEIFTGDTLAPHRRRSGLGCEPMTSPPNAFASEVDLLRLEPQQSTTTRWGVRLENT